MFVFDSNTLSLKTKVFWNCFDKHRKWQKNHLQIYENHSNRWTRKDVIESFSSHTIVAKWPEISQRNQLKLFSCQSFVKQIKLNQETFTCLKNYRLVLFYCENLTTFTRRVFKNSFSHFHTYTHTHMCEYFTGKAINNFLEKYHKQAFKKTAADA